MTRVFLCKLNIHLRMDLLGAGEMAPWLREQAAVPEVMGSIPNKHMVAQNHLLWDRMPSSGRWMYMQQNNHT